MGIMVYTTNTVISALPPTNGTLVWKMVIKHDIAYDLGKL